MKHTEERFVFRISCSNFYSKLHECVVDYDCYCALHAQQMTLPRCSGCRVEGGVSVSTNQRTRKNHESEHVITTIRQRCIPSFQQQVQNKGSSMQNLLFKLSQRCSKGSSMTRTDQENNQIEGNERFVSNLLCFSLLIKNCSVTETAS